MAFYKSVTFLILLGTVCSLQQLIVPCFAWLANWIVLVAISWQGANYIAKRCLYPRLGPLCSDGKAVLITGNTISRRSAF